MSLDDHDQVRCITSEEAEIAQLVRRITADKHEMEKIRTEIDELTQQIRHLVKAKDVLVPILQSLDDLNAQHLEIAALLEKKRLDIGKLEEELQKLKLESNVTEPGTITLT